MRAALTTVQVDPDDGGPVITLRPRQPGPRVVVDELDLGWPTPHTNIRERSGQSGTHDLTYLHGGRVVSMAVRAFDADVARRLLASCSPERRPVLIFQREIDPAPLRMSLAGAVPSAPIDITALDYLEVQLVWRCPDGIIEGVDVASVTLSPAAPSTGVTFPTTVPFTLPASSAPGIAEVVQDGSVAAWPTVRIDGPVTNPTLINDTTGDTFGLVYTLSSGNFIDIDMRNRTVTLNGVGGASLFHTVDLPGSTFWQLAPGLQQVRFTADTSSTPSKATVSWRPAWLW